MNAEVKKYLSDQSEKLYKDKISECEAHIKKQSHRINYLESQLNETKELLDNAQPIWKENCANWAHWYKRLKELK